jgi:hypothetical protein
MNGAEMIGGPMDGCYFIIPGNGRRRWITCASPEGRDWRPGTVGCLYEFSRGAWRYVRHVKRSEKWEKVLTECGK